MTYTIDRIEECLAVCENSEGNTVNIPLSDLPDNVREGDILRKTDDGFEICADETAERRKKMAKLQSSIFTKKK